MVSQRIWIAIVIGVFFAGIGVSYAHFANTYDPMSMKFRNQELFNQMMSNNPRMSQQWMDSGMMNQQQMMNDPQMMSQWMNTMMNDPQMMQQLHEYMMNDPQHMDTMMNNPQHMQTMADIMGNDMIEYMMNNPQMHQQMMNMMMGNQQFMYGMMMDPQFQQNWMSPWMNNSTNWNDMMGSGMMMGGHMMGTPVTQQSEVLDIINNIEKILDDVSTNYRNGDKDTAFSLATSAYLENYEYVEGAIAQKDRTLMEKIELMLRVDLRSMIKNGDTTDNVDMKIDSIKSELTKAKSLF